MRQRKDGGPLFPQGRTSGSVSITEGGMSLRDWFAGQALEGLCKNLRWQAHASWKHDDVMAELVQEAYRIADAMLVARAKSEDR